MLLALALTSWGYVIGLLCNNKDVVTYTIFLTAWLQACFCMNILGTNCATYDYDFYTQQACLILIIINDPTDQYIYIYILYIYIYIYIYIYYIYIYVYAWYWWGNTELLLLHPFFYKDTCWLKPWCFLWLEYMMFSNILVFVHFAFRWQYSVGQD